MEVGKGMNPTKKNKKYRKFKYSHSLFSVILVCILALTGTVGFVFFYDSYIDQTLYAERLSQMREVTTQLFSGLEDVLNNQWRRTSDSCRKLLDANPSTLDGFIGFMQKQAALEDFDSMEMDFVAVDQNGMYYTKGGEQGLLNERSYLSNLLKQVSFISNSLTFDESKMYFLDKLSNPVVLQENGKTVTITYFGILQNMDQLNPYFKCSAYHGNNSVYVVDNDGLKLFSSSQEGDLLKGFNVYNTLKNMQYLHGSSFDKAKKELDQKGIAFSNAVLKNKEIYYSMYKMDNAAWSLIFVVPSQYVAVNTVRLINTTILIVLIFSIVLIVLCILAIVLLMKEQQEAAIAIEKKNNESLEKINSELVASAKRAEHATKEAREASQAKTNFLANMSHDIRTPMNAIVGITGLMEHENDVSDKMRGYIDQVQLSSHHLLSLINDILEMSRIESNEVKLNVESVSLADQIGQVDTIIRTQTNERHQSFRVYANNIAHEFILSDGVRLRQIMLNLLSNAVKYTQDGGHIVLSVDEIEQDKEGYAKFVITVKDTGYGMSKEFIRHIYEPFTRAENSVTNKVQGTGLGMAITKNIVDLMHGEIQIQSELDKGSTFKVILDLPIDKKKNYALSKKHILLISNHKKFIKNMLACTNETPMILSVVSSQKEAFRYLEKNEVQIILIQGCIQNKEMLLSLDVLRKAAKNHVLIYCVDYVFNENDKDRIMRAGVDGIITRPFFVSNLETQIAKTITNTVSQPENESILKGLKFLCAEDNELNAQILEEILHMYGATCTMCSNGEEIVKKFEQVRKGDYDAILMDVQMPQMNGLEATRMIRNGTNPLGKNIPIIAMTANAFSEDIQNCLAAGMNAHIPKPLDIAVLEKTLRGLSVGGGHSFE